MGVSHDFGLNVNLVESVQIVAHPVRTRPIDDQRLVRFNSSSIRPTEGHVLTDKIESRNGSGPIALIAAMDGELRHALDRIEHDTAERVGVWTAYRGQLHEHDVIAMSTGIGMVNAAAAASALLAVEQPSIVFNFGCAGAHRADIHPGDVVIGTGLVAHLSLTVLPGGEERYTGFRYRVGDETILTDVIEADADLFKLAEDAALGWRPEPWPWSVGEKRAPAIHRGIVASADCWTQDPVRIGSLHDLHGSLCEDMEAAAVAQVCAMYQVPMLAIKDISNNELHFASMMEGSDYPSLDSVEPEIGARAFALVERIVQRMDQSPTR